MPILQAYPSGLRLPGQQPRGTYKIDWSHPILQGISYLRILNRGRGTPPDFIDNGTDNNVAGGSTTPLINTLPGGIGLTNDLLTSGTGSNSYQGPTTGSAVCYVTAPFSPTDGVQHVIFECSSAFNLSIQKYSDNNWYAGWNNGGDQRAIVAASGTFSAGDTFSVGFTWSAAAGTTLYTKGISRVNNATSPSTGPTNLIFEIGGGYGNIFDTTGKGGVYYVAIWSRVLSTVEIEILNADPYCFLIPAEGEMPALFLSAAATVQFGWEPQLPLLPHLFYERRGAIARGDDGTAITKINWFNGGWEIQPPPPPHQPREKRGAILPRDDGNELPKINWFNIGWETQPPPPPHPKVESRGAIMPRDDGNQLPKINWFNGGWEVQPPPPATANRRNARAAILRGDDGTEGVYSSAVVIITSGWGFDPNLPLVLRPKRIDASLIGDFGTQSPFILFRPTGFEIALFQPPHPRSERSGSLMRGDDGVQAGKINFFPTGFEAVLHQPNHPRPERSGAIALGDIGYYAPTATVVTSNWGFDAQLWQPPRQIYRAATLPWGDDGTQSQFILFRPTGFEISPVQPPHPRFEQRAAGFLRGDDGNQDILRSWFNAGWEVAPYQPQHVAYAKAGAIMFGDDGTESVYVFIAPAVGTSTWRTLMGVGI